MKRALVAMAACVLVSPFAASCSKLVAHDPLDHVHGKVEAMIEMQSLGSFGAPQAYVTDSTGQRYRLYLHATMPVSLSDTARVVDGVLVDRIIHERKGPEAGTPDYPKLEDCVAAVQVAWPEMKPDEVLLQAQAVRAMMQQSAHDKVLLLVRIHSGDEAAASPGKPS